ncbi:FkbM family methyltransferase [Acetobacter sp. LMG 32666]|uniref:FkbM family methyltransferase n=1 Tax=Acetobacter sp. LMG 32666 TaxID=2959295 RepID=UPI0030C8344B
MLQVFNSVKNRLNLDVIHKSIKVYLLNVRGVNFEPEVAFLKYIIGKKDVCFHIGASDGRHTLIMSRLASQGAIYAFEPSLGTFYLLKNMIFLHGMKNVKAYNMALSDQKELLKLLTPIKMNKRVGRSFACISNNHGQYTREDVKFIDVNEQVTQANTIDNFCAEHGIASIDFIRCDVEGAEEKVLKGGKAIIEKSLPNILIEIHPVSLKTAFETTAENVRDYLLSLGYRMFRLKDGQVVMSNDIKNSPWDDYFFLHPSRQKALSGPFRTFFQDIQDKSGTCSEV